MPPTATAPATRATSGGLRLYLLCAPDGMPIAFGLAPANEPEREIAAALLDRAARAQLLHGQEIYITDKGFAGAEFEQFISRRARLPSTSAPTAATNHGASAHSAASASGSNRSTTPSRASSRSTPRRPHPRRRLDPRLPTRTRARRRLLAQLAHRPTRPQIHRLRPPTTRKNGITHLAVGTTSFGSEEVYGLIPHNFDGFGVLERPVALRERRQGVRATEALLRVSAAASTSCRTCPPRRPPIGVVLRPFCHAVDVDGRGLLGQGEKLLPRPGPSGGHRAVAIGTIWMLQRMLAPAEPDAVRRPTASRDAPARGRRARV